MVYAAGERMSELIGKKRKLEEFAYSGDGKKRFKPAVKPYFPLYVTPPMPYRRRQEKKFIDTNTVYTAWNVSRTYIVLLNGVATGTDYNTRIGREVTMSSYYHRMFISDTTNIQQVRCMLVYDKQPAGALPAITDILQYNDANSPNNLNNRDRFIVVSDKVYTTSPQGVEIKFVKKYKKLRTVTTYNNTGNGIADIATGALYFVAFAFNNVATTTLSGYARVRFVDN